MRTDPSARQGVARRRRQVWAAGLNTAAALALAFVLAGMLHYLAQRHYARQDWSRSKYYALSDKTRSLLKSLTNDVTVIVLFQSGHELLADVDALMKEYQAASPRIRFRRVDPERDLGELDSLAKKYPITEANVVIFDAHGRQRIVGRNDLADYDYAALPSGGTPEITAFKGEQAFSSAIEAVAHGRTPVVYYLSGHGERDPASYDRGIGYAQLARLIRQDNVEIRPLVLGERKAVPPDADALVIAGPRKRIPQPELDLIGQYLDHNGRVLALFESETSTGLESLFERWGVRVGNDLVVDVGRTLGGGIAISRYGRHPITDRMGEVAAVFYRPRSVEPVAVGNGNSADRPRPTRIALTSDAGWAETDPDRKPPRFDPDRDRAGPVCVALAVERGLPPAAGVDAAIRPSRLVVFGDTMFVVNGGIVSGNGDLFMSALNWVLDRDELMAIAPKIPEQIRLDVTPRQVRALGWSLVLGLPLAVVALGLLVWANRRT